VKLNINYFQSFRHVLSDFISLNIITCHKYQMIERVMEKEAVLPANRAWCPFAQCGRMLDKIRSAAPTKITCIWCDAELCGCCAEQWEGHLPGRRCDESKQLSAGDAASESFIRATSKPCPKCNFPTSHLQGHACHHISPSSNSCPRCHIHYCFACSATADENIRDRGSRQKCRCMDARSWSHYCK
jgi:hypothetical protein